MNKKLADLLNGSFELELPKCELTKLGNERTLFSGCGFIRQDKSGNMILTFMKHEENNISDLFNKELKLQNSLVAGELIPDAEYCELKAWDIEGNEWISHKIYVSLKYGIFGMVITAEIPKIENNNKLNIKTKEISYISHTTEAVDFPWTSFTKDQNGERLNKYEHTGVKYSWVIEKKQSRIKNYFFNKRRR